jgi:hypothetical protein
MNSDLIIETNKEVSIKSMIQWNTYSDISAGIPTDQFNEQIINWAKQSAKEFSRMEEIYLIEPKQTPIPDDEEFHFPFAKPASLPRVTCVAKLWHDDVFRNTDKMFSSLCIIWFQEDYAFPIDQDILNKIKEVPFSEVCGEFDY